MSPLYYLQATFWVNVNGLLISAIQQCCFILKIDTAVLMDPNPESQKIWSYFLHDPHSKSNGNNLELPFALITSFPWQMSIATMIPLAASAAALNFVFW